MLNYMTSGQKKNKTKKKKIRIQIDNMAPVFTCVDTAVRSHPTDLQGWVLCPHPSDFLTELLRTPYLYSQRGRSLRHSHHQVSVTRHRSSLCPMLRLFLPSSNCCVRVVHTTLSPPLDSSVNCSPEVHDFHRLINQHVCFLRCWSCCISARDMMMHSTHNIIFC